MTIEEYKTKKAEIKANYDEGLIDDQEYKDEWNNVERQLRVALTEWPCDPDQL